MFDKNWAILQLTIWILSRKVFAQNISALYQKLFSQITAKYLLSRLFQFTANPNQILKYQFGVLLESIVNS